MHFARPPPISTQGPPSPPTLDAPQLPHCLISLGSELGAPLLNDVGEVHVVMDLLDTPELVELSSDDKLVEEPMEDPEEHPEADPEENPELEEH